MKRSTRAEHTAWQKYKKWQKEHIDEIRDRKSTRLNSSHTS